MDKKSLADYLTEMQEEEMRRFKSLPKPVRYISSQCEKCGRLRVELYDNQHLICEKCGWNHTAEEYSTYREFI